MPSPPLKTRPLHKRSTPLAERKAVTPTPTPSIRVNSKNASTERNTTLTNFLKTTASLVSSDDELLHALTEIEHLHSYRELDVAHPLRAGITSVFDASARVFDALFLRHPQ